MNIKDLTPDQLEKMEAVKDFWLDFLFSCTNTIHEADCKAGVEWLYGKANLKKPKVIFAESPMGCKYEVARLSGKLDKAGKIPDDFKVSFAISGNIWDYYWVAYYDFCEKIGEKQSPDFHNYKNLLLAGPYDMVQLEDYCIVSNLPDVLKRDNQLRLHGEDGPAVHFRDDFEVYLWHGVKIPKHWIMDKSSITKKEMLAEKNIEMRRVLREILGGEEYFTKIYGKDALIIKDEDKDHQGNTMRLLETKVEDEFIKRKIQILQVECPSTGRKYDIYPTRESRNVWDAKASTFGKSEADFHPEVES